MVNYGNSKIYKIERISDNVLLYVGSTTKEYLSSRLVEHKNKTTKYPNRKVYKLISDNEGWLNHQILLIKVYPCHSRDELHSEEARFIRALKPVSNIQIPMRTKQEYNIDNCEKIQQYMKEYYIDNSKQINAKQKIYYNENRKTINEKKNQKIYCCCGSTYTYQHKSQHFKSKKHINSITIQFKLIEEMQNNRKKYIFQPIPTL